MLAATLTVIGLAKEADTSGPPRTHRPALTCENTGEKGPPARVLADGVTPVLVTDRMCSGPLAVVDAHVA